MSDSVRSVTWGRDDRREGMRYEGPRERAAGPSRRGTESEPVAVDAGLRTRQRAVPVDLRGDRAAVARVGQLLPPAQAGADPADRHPRDMRPLGAAPGDQPARAYDQPGLGTAHPAP